MVAGGLHVLDAGVEAMHGEVGSLSEGGCEFAIATAEVNDQSALS